MYRTHELSCENFRRSPTVPSFDWASATTHSKFSELCFSSESYSAGRVCSTFLVAVITEMCGVFTLGNYSHATLMNAIATEQARLPSSAPEIHNAGRGDVGRSGATAGSMIFKAYSSLPFANINLPIC